jgi:hypothetical protein
MEPGHGPDIDSTRMLALVVSAVLASGHRRRATDRNRRAATLPRAAILIFMVTCGVSRRVRLIDVLPEGGRRMHFLEKLPVA